MVPGLILIAMFSIYPLVMSWVYSFYDWDGFSATKYFIAFTNYLELARDGFFWRAFGRSVLFAVVSTPVELIVSLALALVLNDVALRGRSVYRTLFFIPVVTTTAIMSIVMSFVFSAFRGPVNEILMMVGITSKPIDFLGNPSTVLWTAIGIAVWKWCGQPMIYWMAGLQSVPSEIYEAARVDGAGLWRTFVNVTLPLLKPFTAMITLIVLAGNLQVFALMQALTGGGPYYASEVMELYIYRLAFGVPENNIGPAAQRLGYASAAGVFFGVMLMIFGISQLIVLRRIRRDSGPVRAAA